MSRSIERSALVSFSAPKMYALVLDIEAYPQYMPGCADAKILDSGDGWLDAKLSLRKSGFDQSFTTRNTMLVNQEINMKLVDGPFKKLDGQWSFQALSDEACKVIFRLNYEFSNPILAFGAGKILDKVAGEQVQAICERAKEIYSK